MNLWQFLWQVFQALGRQWNTVANFLWHNRLEILGYVQSAVALVAASTGVIPPAHLPGWLLASGILNVWIARASPSANKVDITVAQPKEASK